MNTAAFVNLVSCFVNRPAEAEPQEVLYRSFGTVPNSEKTLYMGVFWSVIHKMLCLLEFVRAGCL